MNALQEKLVEAVKEFGIEDFLGEGMEEVFLNPDYEPPYEHDAQLAIVRGLFIPIADAVEEELGRENLIIHSIADVYEDDYWLVLHGRWYHPRGDDFLGLVSRGSLWSLRWDSVEGMASQLESWYNQALARAKEAKPIKDADLQLALAVLRDDVKTHRAMKNMQSYIPPETAERLLAAHEMAVRAIEGKLVVADRFEGPLKERLEAFQEALNTLMARAFPEMMECNRSTIAAEFIRGIKAFLHRQEGDGPEVAGRPRVRSRPLLQR